MKSFLGASCSFHDEIATLHCVTGEEIMEAIWVAAEMRAGGTYAHSALALDTITHESKQRSTEVGRPRVRHDWAAMQA
jgi:hypothetical protein